jgi:hypothetical protein
MRAILAAGVPIRRRNRFRVAIQYFGVIRGHYARDVARCQLDLGSFAGRYTIFVPYAEHPVCETPKDEVVLWRYMDFVKFIALLDSSELRFTRLDHLDDPREGMLTDVELGELSSRKGWSRKERRIGPDVRIRQLLA